MTFESDMAEGMDDAMGALSLATASINGLQVRGSFDPLEEETELVVGGKSIRVAATLILARSQFPTGSEPVSQLPVVVAGRSLRIGSVTSDELAFTLYLVNSNRRG